MWEWNNLAIPALLLGPVAVLGAWQVYRSRPHAALNRTVAAAVLVTGVMLFAAYGLRSLTHDRTLAVGLHRTMVVFFTASSALFLLASTMFPTRASRSLARTWVRVALVTCALAWTAVILWQPRLYTDGYVYSDTTGAWSGASVGPLFTPFLIWHIAAMGLAAALSWQAYRVASSDLLRAKYRWIARAIVVGAVAQGLPIAIIATVGTDSEFGLRINWLLWPAGAMLFTLMAAYAFTKAESVDGEVRTQRLLRRGTLAAIGVPALLIAFQVGTEVLNETLGLGLGAAVMAIMLAFGVPLQKWVHRATEGIAPGASEPAYWEERKRRIFEAALEGALADGRVTGKEERMLQNLQLELGISNDEADTMRSSLTMLGRAPAAA